MLSLQVKFLKFQFNIFQETKILANISGKTVVSSLFFIFLKFILCFCFAVREKKQLKKLKSVAFTGYALVLENICGEVILQQGAGCRNETLL